MQDVRKEKQSIRRKSQKSTSARRKSTRGSTKNRGLKGSKIKSPLWDEEELSPNDVMAILSGQPYGESPIDLELSTMKKITTLPPLQWLNTENKSYAAKIANTGRTVTVTGLWSTQEYPTLKGGPLVDEFRFSQMHFHWGQTEKDGSEHLVDHEHYPFEIHAVFHNSIYGNHERARRESDGIIVVVYFCGIAKDDASSTLHSLLGNIDDILIPPADRRIKPFNFAAVLPVFTDDYILYKGWIKNKCKHATLWFICRETLGIGENQLTQVRRLLDFDNKPILKNYRDIKELGYTKIFIVSPSNSDVDSVLHPRLDTLQGDIEEGTGKIKSIKASINQGKKKSSRHRRKSSTAPRASKVGQRKSKIGQRKSKIPQKKTAQKQK